MSVYKTDRWLREALDSVIAQDIGFKNNVQLIIVNDGSPDDSEPICIEYQEKYPSNIIYVKKENGGLASARNVGLTYASGELVNFFDPDDTLTPNTLSEVYAFFSAHKKHDLAFLSVPLAFFEAKTGRHPKYNLIGDKNRIIDVDVEPHNFILSSASSFYPIETFKSISFKEHIFGAEDSDLNLRILKENRKIGYIGEKGVEYGYRQRYSSDSIMNQAKNNPQAYLSAAEVYIALYDSFKDEGHIPQYFKEALMWDLRNRISSFDKNIFTKNQYKFLQESYVRLTKIISKSDLMTSPATKNKNTKLLFYTEALTKRITKLSPNGAIVTSDDMNTGLQFKFYVRNIELLKDRVLVEGFFHGYQIKGIKLSLISKDDRVVEPVEAEAINTPHDVKAGIREISKTNKVRFEMPYTENQEYRFVATWVGAKKAIPVKVAIFQYSAFALKLPQIRLWRNGYAVRFYNKMLVITKEKRSSKLNHFRATFAILKLQKSIKIAFMRIFLNRKNKYILICDRPGIAGDNGEAIFRYINESESNLAKKTYFVILKDSKLEDSIKWRISILD